VATGLNDTGRSGRLQIRSPQRFFAGLVLIAVCFFVLWAVGGLRQGTLTEMGPGMFPRALAVMLGVGGAILVVLSFLLRGAPLEKWSFRGPILVSVAILLFALTIRPFGLAVAGMLALVVSGFATPEARPREVLVFSALLTVACIVLFRYILGMSVSVLTIPGTGIQF
jgi:hypothetical protein